jgi:Arc/MetJ-type ribon-helix-helix transcriptional regulator
VAIGRLTVFLTRDLRDWIDARISDGQFASASDYVATLLRNDRQRLHTDALLIEGIESGEPIEPGPEHWQAKKAKLKRHTAIR